MMANATAGLIPNGPPPWALHAQLRPRNLLFPSRLVNGTAAATASRFFPNGRVMTASETKSRRSGRKKKPLRPIFSPVMEWQDCSAEIEIDVPCSIAYDCYSDRESIPLWMPFISSVKVVKDKPDLSRWLLKYEVFGQDVEFSWLARNFQPIRNQKIHWRSLEGLPNRGAVRFYPKSPSSCKVDLTVSYEVPQVLTPVASALRPFLQGLLLQGLEQFAVVAKDYQKQSPS